MLVCMSNAAALPLPECESGCGRAAIRGAYCAEHAIACTGCWAFFSADELVDGECAHCRRQACGEELDSLVGAQCWCEQHKAVR